ncbi:MAG: cation-translocating P-type ATPase [Chloroflexi bacterium]|nr:cation-translocating P-type ATPase [Chloroflexota bacterium]
MTTEAHSPSVKPATQTPAISNKDVLLAIEGMSCASCAMRIEKGVKKLPGVYAAAVNLATEQATVSYAPDETTLEQMVQKVEALGYKATPLIVQKSQPEADEHVSAREISPAPTPQEESTQRKEAALHRRRNTLVLGLLLTLPVVVLSMFFMNRFQGENYLLLLLTTPVWLVVGWEFHRNALFALRHGGATMDTLVSLGSTAAYLLSAAATLFPHLIITMTTYDSSVQRREYSLLGKTDR